MHDHTPDHMPLSAASVSHPLLARLEVECGYPRLQSEVEVEAFLERPGVHCLFIPGDPRRNLETADVAVILPELRLAFQNAFDCALINDAIEADLRERSRALKTPGLLFYRGAAFLGAIEKVRDWPDYLSRIGHILSRSAA